MPPSLLAHAGEGASWQALVTALAVGVAVIFVLALIGRVQLKSGNDLVLPLAAVAIVASLAPTASTVLSDWVWWAFPIGVVALLGVLVATFTGLELTVRGPLAITVVALAAIAVVVFDDPITLAWHPPPDFLPTAADAEVVIDSPEDGATLDAGEVSVEVAVSGASIGPGDLAEEQVPADPATAGGLRLFLDGIEVDAEPEEDCTLEAPCDTASYEVEMDPGEHELYAELTRGDGVPFGPSVTARAEFTTE